MKSKKACIFIVIVLVFLITALIPVWAGAQTKPAKTSTATTATTAAQTYVLKFGDHNIATQPAAVNAIIPSLKKVEELSKGKIKIESYFGGTLVTANTAYESLLSGLIDIGKPGEYAKGAFMVMTIGAMPFAAKDPQNIVPAVNAIIKKGYMDESLKGLKYLTVGCSTPYNFLFKDKKPLTLKDMKGIKVRSPGSYLGNGIEALGLTPITVTPAEAYDALSKGVIRGAMWSLSSFVAYKMHDLGKYLLLLNAQVWSSSLFAMNEKSLNNLPDDLKKIVLEELGDKLGRMQVEAYVAGDIEATAALKAKGIEIYTLSAAEEEKARKAVLPVWEAAISDLNKKGLPGKKIITEFVTELKKLGEDPPWSP